MDHLYRSPVASDQEEDLEIELSSNKRRILDYYKKTGQFCQKPTFETALPSPPLPKATVHINLSPVKRDLDRVEKIEQAHEDEENIQTKKSDFGQNTLLMHTFARPVSSRAETEVEYPSQTPNQRLQMQVEFAEKERLIRKEVNEVLFRLKHHQQFIVQLIFSMGLADRLQNDFEKMLQVAEDNFTTRKQVSKKKEEDKMRYEKDQRQKKENIGRGRLQEQKLHTQITERQRSGDNCLRPVLEKMHTPNMSPVKMFKPVPGVLRGLEFSSKRSSFNQSTHKISTSRQGTPTKFTRAPLNTQNSKVSVSPISKSEAQDRGVTPFQAKLQQRIKLISEGRPFKRICFITMKIQPMDVFCSADFRKLVFRLSGKESFAEPMEEFVKVTLGRSSKNFQPYVKPGQTTEDYLSFSVVFARRTVDLQASTLKERNEFVEALQELSKLSKY